MEVGIYIIGILGLAGFAFGAYCYHVNLRWSRQCKQARIAIAYKRKVKMDYALVDWMTWVKLLERDSATGKVVYNMGGTSVAVIKGASPPRKRRRKKHGPTLPSRNGTWSAKDETVKTNA